MKRLRPYLLEVFIAVTAFVVVIAVVFILLARQQARPPFTYTQGEYTAERHIYLPGDTLTYTASLTIERAGAINLIRGWRTRPGSGRAQLCSGENAPVIQDTPPPFPPSSVGTEVEGRVNVVIPDLSPGDYWLVSAVSKHDGGESLTQVAFSISVPCDGR